MHVLVVEDDPEVASALCETLALHGFFPIHAPTGQVALKLFGEASLILLDLGLPDLDGLEVCRRIRAQSSVPIIVLSARTEEIDRVLGLTLGADDYLSKPYGQRELLARIEAVMRRLGAGASTASTASTSSIASIASIASISSIASTPSVDASSESDLSTGRTIGELRIDERSHRVWARHELMALTKKEYEILRLLAAEPGALVTREDLLLKVWGGPWLNQTRTIDVHVSSLRQKLAIPDFVETIRGVGYRLNA